MSRLPRQTTMLGLPIKSARLIRLPLLSRFRGKDEDARDTKRVGAIIGVVVSLLLLVGMAYVGAWLAVASMAATLTWSGVMYVANREGRGRSGKGEVDKEALMDKACGTCGHAPPTSPPGMVVCGVGATTHVPWVARACSSWEAREKGSLLATGSWVVGWSSQAPRGSASPKLTITFGSDESARPPTSSLLARPAVLDGHLVFTLPAMPAETPESIVVVWDETETRVARLTTFTPPEPYPGLPLFILREQGAVAAKYYVVNWFGIGEGEPMTPAQPAVDTWWVLDGRDLWPLKPWLSWQADKVIDRYLDGWRTDKVIDGSTAVP